MIQYKKTSQNDYELILFNTGKGMKELNEQIFDATQLANLHHVNEINNSNNLFYPYTNYAIDMDINHVIYNNLMQSTKSYYEHIPDEELTDIVGLQFIAAGGDLIKQRVVDCKVTTYQEVAKFILGNHTFNDFNDFIKNIAIQDLMNMIGFQEENIYESDICLLLDQELGTGYTTVGKAITVLNAAKKFATYYNYDQDLIKELYVRTFDNVTESIDVPLTRFMLDKIDVLLKQVIDKSPEKTITNENKFVILKKWQANMLEFPVDCSVQAYVIKSEQIPMADQKLQAISSNELWNTVQMGDVAYITDSIKIMLENVKCSAELYTEEQ